MEAKPQLEWSVRREQTAFDLSPLKNRHSQTARQKG
jgi:hypothetical protein